MTIDVHAHVMPVDYVEQVAGMGGSYQNRFNGYADAMTLQKRLVMMDEAGVDCQILSPTCAPYAEDVGRAVRAARRINDHYHQLQLAHPGRFALWTSLPLPHVEESIAEMARGYDALGAKGVVLGCFCLGSSIADPRFDPIYAALNERAATVFLHPCQNGICSDHVNEWGLTVCVGASLEDSLAALHLVKRAIPARFPRLRFIVPHFGGILATLLARLDGQMPREGLAEAPSKTLRGFYYDTVGWGSRPALLAAVEGFGISQIVTGSDFPILLRHESYRQTFDNVRLSGLPAGDIAAIMSNAKRLLGERR